MLSDAAGWKIHLFKWVSGDQRQALGTAVSWDWRLLGKSWLSLCAPCSVKEAEISATKEGLGMCPALTEARKSLSLMSSWHQWVQPAQLCSPCSQLTVRVTSSASDLSSGTAVEFYTSFWDPCHQLLSEAHHTSNTVQSLCPNHSTAVAIEGPKQNASFTFGE